MNLIAFCRLLQKVWLWKMKGREIGAQELLSEGSALRKDNLQM